MTEPVQEPAGTTPFGVERDPARVVAFSDGVIAIAITLLVLEIHPPHDTRRLAHGLAELWPSYLAYVVTFMLIGQVWANHHIMFDHIRSADRMVLFLNTVLLMDIAFLPFAASVLAEAFREGHGERTAVVLHGVAFEFAAVLFNVIWWYARRDRRLLAATIDAAGVTAVSRRFGLALVWLATGTALGALLPALGVAVIAAFVLYYWLPIAGEIAEVRRRRRARDLRLFVRGPLSAAVCPRYLSAAAASRVRWWWRLAFIRLPQTAIEHQRALSALLRSMRNSRHSGLAHGRSRPGIVSCSALHARTAATAGRRPAGTSGSQDTPAGSTCGRETTPFSSGASDAAGLLPRTTCCRASRARSRWRCSSALPSPPCASCQVLAAAGSARWSWTTPPSAGVELSSSSRASCCSRSASMLLLTRLIGFTGYSRPAVPGRAAALADVPARAEPGSRGCPASGCTGAVAGTLI